MPSVVYQMLWTMRQRLGVAWGLNFRLAHPKWYNVTSQKE